MRVSVSIAFAWAAAAASLSACAPMEGAPANASSSAARNQCFDAATLRNYRAVQGRTLYVRTSRNDVFELQSVGACNDLDGAVGIALIPDGGSISRLCPGDGAEVRVRGGPVPSGPCRVRVTRMLTETEVAALPDRDRP